MLPGMLTDTVDSLQSNIADREKRIEKNKDDIVKTKAEIAAALSKSGVELAPDQIDLLLDSVLSGDLVRLVATFNAAKVIDTQLGKLLTAAGDNMNSARKYFAMSRRAVRDAGAGADGDDREDRHELLPKLDSIMKDIASAQAKTQKLLGAENRPDQAARAAGQPRCSGGRLRCRARVSALPAGSARADREGAYARDARPAHRRQYL